MSTQDDTGFFFLETRHPASYNTSRPKLIVKRRTGRAHSNGLRQQTKNNKNEVCRQTDRQAMMERHRQPHGSTGRPSLLGGKEKEGRRIDSPKQRLSDNAEQNILSNCDQLQHAPPTPKWVGTNERAVRSKTGQRSEEAGGAVSTTYGTDVYMIMFNLHFIV